MNTLSWLIYFAEIADKISFMSASIIIVCLFYSIFRLLFVDLDRIVDLPSTNKLILISVFFMVIGSFTPSRQTVMMIAASEYGEKIIKSEQTQKIVTPAMELLEKWMLKELSK
jgi:hypothetical protein